MPTPVDGRLYRIGTGPAGPLPFLFACRRDDENGRWILRIDFDSMVFTVEDSDPLKRVLIRGKPSGFTTADIAGF